MVLEDPVSFEDDEGTHDFCNQADLRLIDLREVKVEPANLGFERRSTFQGVNDSPDMDGKVVPGLKLFSRSSKQHMFTAEVQGK